MTGGELLRTSSEPRLAVSAVAFSRDGGRLAIARFDRRVHVVEPATGKLLHTLGHTGLVNAAAFSSDGRRHVAGGVGAGGRTGIC